MKGKIMILFKTNLTEDVYKPKSVNNVYRGGKEIRKLKSLKEKTKNNLKATLLKM